MPLVTLNQINNEGDTPKVVCRIGVDEGCSFDDFRRILDEDQMFPFPFEFWDNAISSRMMVKHERRNKVKDYDYVVTVTKSASLILDSARLITPQPSHLGVVRSLDDMEKSSNIWETPILGSSDGSNPIGISHGEHSLASGSHSLVSSDANEFLESETPVPSSDQNIALPSPSSSVQIQLESVHLDQVLKSHLRSASEKLQEHMKSYNMGSHAWRIKSWDEGSDVRVQLECLECNIFYSGQSKGKLDKLSISNCFNNFKKTHLKSAKHHANFARKRKLPLEEDELLANAKRQKLDDRQQVESALQILEKVNAAQSDVPETFFRLGDLDREPFHAYYFRVKCSLCGDIFQLCPPQRNLEHNLGQHCASSKHIQHVEASKQKQGETPLLSGRPGRPRVGDKRDTRQKTIHRFFGSDQGRPSSSSSSQTGMVESTLDTSLLCWGFWRDFVHLKGNDRPIKSLLDDQNSGLLWFAEPHVRSVVMNPHSGERHVIDGLFRHKNCSRISELGGGFLDLTCEHCHSIKSQTDFRLRVLRETMSTVKRGTRDTSKGRRLDSLTNSELRSQARNMSRSIALEKRKVRNYCKRLCLLESKCPSLREVVGESANRGDLMKFCTSIVNAHKRGAFGGREALWDLLRDIVFNLNRKRTGRRYSQGTKVIMQALFQHGGRRVVDCLSMNLIGPSLNTLQRDRRGFVYFRPGFQESQFMLVVDVLSKMKNSLGIVGDVPVIIAEDETAVKKSIRWMPKTDMLIGFCGPKQNHVCECGLEIKVGDGEQGFENIVSAFDENVVGNYARVFMVNPLHASFPRLCIMACAVCNRFDASWVRQQWDQIESMWIQFCRPSVGPLIGHASDGDSRRRKLMLEDYVGGEPRGVSRESLGWEGWVFSHSVVQSSVGQDVSGLHDQDFIHNAKKLGNPLDSCKKILKLGAFCAMHEHRIQVFKCMEDHGMNADDIARTDRQNWSSTQRLCSRKVISCLRSLRLRKDVRVELTNGTEAYLTISADYIDIFMNTRLTLRERIVLCGKVSFFFRLWRLWLEHGNHSVGGNTQVLTMDNMVPVQTFYDVQMSCYFVVALIVTFRNKYSSLPIPLHLTGSDSCEQFFSKVGGMKGHERNYDFCELVEAATSLNRLAQLDQHDGVLSVGKSHKKFKNIWMKLHPMLEGDKDADLSDYKSVAADEVVIEALKEGLLRAQELCVSLQMCPSTSAADQRWFRTPWVLETKKAGIFRDCLQVLQTAEKEGPQDKDEEVLLQDKGEEVASQEIDGGNTLLANQQCVDFDVDDGVEESAFIEGEFRHCMSDLVSEISSNDVEESMPPPCIVPTVSYGDKVIYKSTLVSQLVGNPTLSKDRLTRVRQTLYFNNLVDKPFDKFGQPTILLTPGSECGVYFEEEMVLPRTRSNAPKGKNVASRGKRVSSSSNALQLKRTWYLGRVQKIRKKYGGKWGRAREPIDLLNRPTSKDGEGTIVEVLLNWFTRTNSRLQFKYDSVDGQWIPLEAIISLVHFSIDPAHPSLFILDPHDARCLDEFVAGSQ